MVRHAVILVGFGFAVWAFCGALIFAGRQATSMETTLIVHALGAPVGAAFFSWIYFSRFGFTSPLVTAFAFVAVSLALDVFVVALLIERSFDMFRSVLGVWIPQALIFTATWLTGSILQPASSSPGGA